MGVPLYVICHSSLVAFNILSLSLSFVSSVQFSSVQALSCVRLCNPMNRSTPGLPVRHQLPESTQTHVHWVGDAIQPSHPLSSPSPPARNVSQHQGLFQFVSSITMCLSVFLLGFILPGTLYFLDLVDYFLSHVREVFNFYLFKYFLESFLSLFSFWCLSNSNVGAFNVVLEVS